MEVKNRLLNYTDMYIYQNDDWFMFSLDSVLLANFVNIRKNDNLIIDFCTGNAPVPLFLSTKTKNVIYGIEIQKEIYDLAKKSVETNNLQEQISLYNMSIRDIKNSFKPEIASIVTCNPPYFKVNESRLINENSIKAVARHELLINLDDIFKNASYLLCNNGKLFLVHRNERLIEIISKMREYNLEPKRITFVYSNLSKNSEMFLIEAIKNGHTGLKVESPIVVYDSEGNYTDMIKKMFQERK